MTILLLDRLAPEAQSWLESRYAVAYRPELATDAAGLRAALGRVQALLLTRKVVVTREFLSHAPRLRVITRLHGGSDNTDLEACSERGVAVVRSGAASVRSNAEYLLTSLLMLYRRGLGEAFKGLRHVEPPVGREIHGSLIGLVGLAPTTHALVILLQALGARLIGYDPAIHPSAPVWQQLQIKPVGLSELMASADAVSVQMLYASRYRHFIGHKVLAHCRRGQFWVSISRSDLFDPEALAEALTDGRIEACVLDGAEAGFAASGSPLHDLDNLYITPRIGAHTREARERASWHVVHRLDEALSSVRFSDSDASVNEAVDVDALMQGAPGLIVKPGAATVP